MADHPPDGSRDAQGLAAMEGTMAMRPTAGKAPIHALGVATLMVAAIVAPAFRAIGADPPARDVPPRRLEGPPIDDPRVPEGPDANRAGTDVPGAEVVNQPTLRADAGDDQVGLVGRQITLNGGRSRGKGRVGYRWFQVGGPRAVAALQDRHFLTFAPPAAGVYRFGLVVAAGSEIAEIDTVDVLVGLLPPAPAPAAPAPAALPSSLGLPAWNPPPAPAPSLPIEDLARSTLLSLDGGSEAAAPLASTFEALASRIELYRTYSDLFSEMSRRLEIFVPQDPARRAQWVRQLFTPLTARLVEQLRTEGLDLTRGDGPTTPLTPAQKSRLADLFGAAAKGFRATLPPG